MNLSSRKKLFLYTFLLVILVGVFYWIVNEYGLVKYYNLKNEVNELKQQISEVENENEKLKNEIDSLKRKVPAKVESVAREKYGMKRPGEIRIEVDDEKSENK
jgi:cell division protein FtsL